ncbi:hypothetical protein GE061_008733 [Apolygus lucorum]|uniref:Uncharacterized protein n=1 Tax=Apolygus lucorum TaxID=248454 RepID=A0A6A4IXY6_APOLU|nr:hypothetical protein GE061_008733 [Apolygus lucorum]
MAAASCEFAECDNMIRDRLVSQIHDNALLNRLLDEGESLTLERAVELCKRNEARKQEIVDFQESRTSQEDQHKLDAMRERKDELGRYIVEGRHENWKGLERQNCEESGWDYVGVRLE